MTVENISIDVKTNAGSAAKQFRSLSSALSSVSGAAKNVGGNRSGSAAHSIKSVGNAAKSATGAVGKLFASIKRIAFYRLLRTIIKEITQAFQEGLKNVYAFSKAMNTGMAQALDRIASASGQMKNQMGAAFGELLYTIEPIITAIISLVTSLMRALSALFAALGGRLTYTVADKTAKSWDKAAGSAKEYKNTILGFDEINRLNDETGGGGGGDTSIDGLAEVELPDWAKLISEAIQRGAWGTAGKLLADHINQVIDEWDSFGAGQRLGEKINNAIKFAFNFLQNFNAGNLGAKIAGFLNGALSKINTGMLGATLVSIFTNIFDFAIGFLTNVDTAQLATKISDFIKGAFNKATEWINSKDWSQIGETLLTKLGEFLINLDVAGIAESISTFLGSAVRAAIQLLTPLNDWLTEKWNEDIKGADFTETMSNLFEKIGEGLGDIVGWVRDHIIVPFMDALLDKGNWKDADKLKEDVVHYMNYLEFYIRGISLKIGWIIQDLGRIIKAVKDGDMTEAYKGMQQLASDASIDVGKSAEEMADRVTKSMDSNSNVTVDWGKTFTSEMEKTREETSKTETSFTGLKETTQTVFGAASTATSEFSGDYSSFASTIVGKTSWISENIGALLGKLASLKTSFDLATSSISAYQSQYGSFMGEAVRQWEIGSAYASGGFPGVGEVFIAREAGPELVGTINGHTAVANNDQIVEAVASGVYEAVSAAMGNTNERPMQVRVYLDSREIRTGQQRYAMAMGV